MVGNIPNFVKLDIIRCFLRFERNIGRQELARELELGEGTVRTILELLKSKKFLNSTKKGHLLSQKGHGLLNSMFQYISMPRVVNLLSLYPQFKKIGIVIKNAGNLRELYKLRDIAVKNGAEGALILRFEHKLYAPESDYKQDYNELEKYFNFENNDILALAFSDKVRNAEYGALAIAVELNNTLKDFVSEF